MPVTFCLAHTLRLILQVSTVDSLPIARDICLVLEAGLVSELHLPGHGPAGGVDEEVCELAHNVGECHEGEVVHILDGELSHVAAEYLSLSLPYLGFPSKFHALMIKRF